MHAILRTDLPFPKRSGKVRDVYDVSAAVGTPSLLIVATDRISAFDVIMSQGIPGKGRILTQISNFWFAKLGVPNHLIETDAAKMPPAIRAHAETLDGRAVLVKKTRVVPIECVARGYLAGSGWKEYQESGSVCGVALPAGLKQCGRLPEPIFTPATKAETGHDQNISFEQMREAVGDDIARELRARTLDLYLRAAEFALSRGIIIADTKFEFGLTESGELILIDEALTPDSSRFWPAADYEPGRDQASFDKQFLRNWLEQQPWNKQPPPPTLPPQIIEGTRQRYEEALSRLTS